LAKRPKLNTKKHPNQERYATEVDSVVTANIPPARTPIQPKTENQKRLLNAINTFDVVFATGPAGTGKTYIPTARAAEALMAKKIDKIVITRPVVEAGESLGFLPGELDEKYEPYLAPVRQILIERMGQGPFEYALKTGKIEPVPLAYMRGMTFRDCIVILDEAQNVTPKQMKMFLTRIGENCKVIVCGDSDQVDLSGPSGLEDAVKRCSWIPNVKVINFGLADVVRSGLVMDVLKSYAS
jgi:phosphate starvation-inducible protein PhoH and related proteins